MEKQSKTTRFCLICNYISRIIEPLTSRCSKFRFKALTSDTIKSRLQYVAEQEMISFKEEVVGGKERLITYVHVGIRYYCCYLRGRSPQGDIVGSNAYKPDEFITGPHFVTR